jgi:predicted RNA binding protein YcfA (HicA-like mRNA interferase family)
MTKIDKLLARIRNNPKNVTFDDLRKVLEAYGFELRRSEGSHRMFKSPLAPDTLLVIPFKRPYVKVKYVEDALALIDKIDREQATQ